MAINNNLLINAAYVGAISGIYFGRNIKNPLAAFYSPQVTAAQAIAVEIDALIPNDPTISAVGGVALPPTTAPIQEAQLAKTDLLSGICASVFGGQNLTDINPLDYAAVGAGIVALYTEAIARLAS